MIQNGKRLSKAAPQEDPNLTADFTSYMSRVDHQSDEATINESPQLFLEYRAGTGGKRSAVTSAVQ
jgi:hypothetical protein